MPTEHKPAKRWMAVRLRIEYETWKHVKGVTRNRYWNKMTDAGQEEVWLHVKPSDPEMEQYKHDNACRNRGSSADYWWVTRSKTRMAMLSKPVQRLDDAREATTRV